MHAQPAAPTIIEVSLEPSPQPPREPRTEPELPIILIEKERVIKVVNPVLMGMPPALPPLGKTIRSEAPANNSGEAPETIPKNSETIPESAQNGPRLNIPVYTKESEVGRKRKYEDTGIYGDIPVRDVVLFRHIKQRHWPGMSADMREWYEWFYFVEPQIGEQPFRGKSYEQHRRSYNRGQRWIAEHTESRNQSEAGNASAAALGDSGATIIPFPKSARS